MKEQKQFFIFKDNGIKLWTDPVDAENEPEAIEKATLLFQQLPSSEQEKLQSFLLCEGYDAGVICGGFYDDDDSEGAWIIEKEIIDFSKDRKQSKQE